MVNFELLKGYTNQENALIVENYPYGYQRTQKRYWIETHKKKGDRLATQTLNPKTKIWNKPKKSTYNAIMVLYRNLENNHIKTFSIYPSTSKETIKAFEDRIKGFQLLQEQQEQLRIMKAYSKAYEGVTFECRAREYKHKVTGEITSSVPIFEMDSYIEVDSNGEPVNKEEEEKQQKEVKQTINKIASYYYHKGE